MPDSNTIDLSGILAGQQIGSIPIANIRYSPRQRKVDLSSKDFEEHVAKLSASIQRVGLMHPITLEDESDELIAGFCRIQAFMRLGKTEIPYVRRKDLSALDRKRMELEENLQRMGLEWWMEAAAIAEIDNLQRAIAEANGETWSQQKTAEMVGKSVGTVNQATQLHKEIAANPELKKASGLVGALKQLQTKKQLEKRKEDIARREAGLIKTYPAEILVGDALELIRREEDESYDAIITNFPFGVDLTLGKDGKKPYHDEEDYIVKLVRAVTHESYRVLKNDSWMVAFFDMRKITYSNKQREFVAKMMDRSERLARLEKTEESMQTHQELMQLGYESLGLTSWMEEAGFSYVQLMPAVWVKPNKTQGMIGDPRKGLISAYEAFVFAAKGNAILLKQGLQNIFIYDTPPESERVHPLQMSFDLCTRLVSMVSLGQGRILDPFAGSGSVGVGALNNQCSFRGFELSEEKASNGNMLLKEHVLAKVER